MKIKDNRLLFWTAIAFAAYWIIGFAAPWSTFAPVVHLMLIVASGLTFMRYVPEALAILIEGRRNEDSAEGDGSHLAILGLACIGLGGIMAALAALAMIMPSIKGYVAGTPFELVGRATAIAGLLLVFISPSVTKDGVRFDAGGWIYLIAAIVMAGVYAVGYGAGQRHEENVFSERQDHLPDDAPRCAPDRPIWGSESGVYHDRSSPYRRLVHPAKCFASVNEARSAGYRAPG